jgi:ketosteroid isomerase-like protein
MAATPRPILARIHDADRLIMAEEFEALMDMYTDDALLIVKPRTRGSWK